MASEAKDSKYFESSNIDRSEYLGFAGAAILFGSLFLPWFGTSDSNPNSMINGERSPGNATGAAGDFTAWEVFGSLDWWLVAACAAPFILGWIVARGHGLSWRPGEVTMIVGITAFVLILLNGVVLGKPDNGIEISFGPGYFVGMLGAALICVGGVLRQAVGVRGRKPPGTF